MGLLGTCSKVTMGFLSGRGGKSNRWKRMAVTPGQWWKEDLTGGFKTKMVDQGLEG